MSTLHKPANYRPEIDGLRAIAVVPVILFHAGIPSFSGGFVGVDIFFVISGYLITSIIVKELDKQAFSLGRFYERRARRILPALLVVMLATIPLVWISAIPSEMKDFSQSLLAVLSFASNFLFWQESGYFEGAAELKPLLHTWSLGVEEQFYVVFPIITAILWRMGFSRTLIAYIAILFASLLVSEWMLRAQHVSAAFYLLPSRFWELLAGSLLAMAESRQILPKPRGVTAAAACIGVSAIAASIFLYSNETAFPGLAAIFPVFGTVFVIYGTSTNNLVTRLLSNRLFVGIGLISYSAYLWHQPLFAFARLYTFDTAHLDVYKVLAVIAFLLAYLTWKFVENPMRDRDRLSLRSFLIIIGSGSLAVAAFAVTGIATQGFDKQFNKSLSPTERVYYDNAKQGDAFKQKGEKFFNYGDCTLQTPDVGGLFVEQFNACSERYGKATIVLGDSHSGNIFQALLAANKRPEFLVNIGRGSCRPADARQKCDILAMRSFIIENANKIEAVIFSQAGFYFFEGMNSKRMRKNTQPLIIDTNYIKTTLEFLAPLSEAVTTYWLTPWIEPHVPLDNPREMGDTSLSSLDYKAINKTGFIQLDKTIAELAEQQLPKLRIRSMIWHEQKAFIPLYDDGCVSFRDADHLSNCGKINVSDIIVKKLSD